MRSVTHTVILGGGMAGSLAAAAAAQHSERVTIIERDDLPTTPAPRRGVPQARHAHVLWSGGARAIEALVPGVTQQWLDAGAHHVTAPAGMILLTPQGWIRRASGPQFLIACSRDLLEFTLRERVLAADNITVRPPAQAHGLIGDPTSVTGVVVKETHSEHTETLDADLVIDATGRGSRARHWLADLGLPAVPEEVIDCGLVYATRLFRAPSGAGARFPVITLQADPRAGRPGQSAVLMPIENGHWLVTLSGTRGGEPTDDPQAFADFARRMNHSLVADLIPHAEPLSPVHITRATTSRRFRYDRLRQWPDGFLVVGDALAAFNPVYGHGMSAAALTATALRDGLSQGVQRGQARKLQQTIARATEAAWFTSATQDVRYPGAIGPRLSLATRLGQRYLDRLMKTATDRPAATTAVFDAYSLSAPFTRLTSPRAVLAAILGPSQPPLTSPPLGADEQALLDTAGPRTTDRPGTPL